jgi:hypothetical protein
MRFSSWPFVASALSLLACSGSPPETEARLPTTQDDGGSADGGPRKDGEAPDADAGPVVDAPTALRKCVLECERAAPADAVQKYTSSLQACSCKPELGKCAAACPKFCPAGATMDSNACGDCIARAYEVTCAAELKCEGDMACVDFADCTRACIMKNP